MLHSWWTAYSRSPTPFTLHLAGPSPLPPLSLFVLFALPYFLCLHWGYLTLIVPDVDLNASAFQHGLAGLLLIAAVSLTLLTLIIHQLRLIHAAKAMRLYLTAYAAAAAIILYVSILWRATYTFHLHHALIGPLLLPLTRFRTPLSVVCQAILAGLFINGIALWGWQSDWDATPGAGGGGGGGVEWDAMDAVAPRGLRVRGMGGERGGVEVVWEWRNATGTSIGSVLYVNSLQGFHDTWQRTEVVWNATGWNESASVVAEVGGGWGEVDEGWYETVGGGIRRHPLWGGATGTGVGHALARPLSAAAAVPGVWGDAGDDGDPHLFARARLNPLLPGLNYTVFVCFLHMYGVLGACSSTMASTLPAPLALT